MNILKKFTAALIPIGIFILTLFFLLRTQEKIEDKQSPVVRQDYEKLRAGDLSKYPLFEQAFTFAPGSSVRVKKFWNDILVYDVIYDFNDHGLRLVPGGHQNTDQHVINGGCSFIYGEGLPVEETLSAVMKKSNPKLDVVNFAQAGGGLHMILRTHDFYPYSELSNNKKGTFIYHFMSDHLNRWFADPSYLQWSPAHRPFYKVENKIPVFKGEISEQENYKNFQKAKSLGVEKALIKANGIIDRKQEWSTKELDEFSDAVLYLKKLYLKDFPAGKFVFVMHPQVDFTEKLISMLTQILNQKDIEVFDAHKDWISYLDSKKIDPRSMNIKHDGHPSAEVNVWYSDWMLKKIVH